MSSPRRAYGQWASGKAQGELSGPARIVKETAKAAKSGWVDLLELLGVLSAYLAAFNLLPVPALDGARLMFLGYEAATRRRPNARIEANVHAIGLVMMLGLMLYVTFVNDLRLTGRPSTGRSPSIRAYARSAGDPGVSSLASASSRPSRRSTVCLSPSRVASSVLLAGTALHRGGPAAVRLSRIDGPITFAQAGATARLDELHPVRTDRGVTLATSDGRVRVDLVEHLLAAAAGLGVSRGLLVEVTGDEIPLLDGAALRFAEALAGARARRRPAAAPPRGGRGGDRARALRVPLRARAFAQRPRRGRLPPAGRPRERGVGRGRRRLRRADRAGAHLRLDTRARRAPRRGPGRRRGSRERDRLRRAGSPRRLPRPEGPDEPARHKLLDLIGDLALYGGPPLGEVDAFLPGHTATHAIAARALSAGVLVRARA